MIDKAGEIIRRWEDRKLARRNFDNTWQEISDLVRPNGGDFTRMDSPGRQRTNLIYDGTPTAANEQLASGLESSVTPSDGRFFEVRLQEGYDLKNDYAALQWLQDVADIIYSEYARESASLHPALHEAYLDIGAFGTAIINQEYDRAEQSLKFRTFPLGTCWLGDDAWGQVDSVDRLVEWTTRQLYQFFTEAEIPKKIADCAEKEPNRKWKVLHSVFPRADRNPFKIDSKNKPMASAWVSVETKDLLREGGYDSFPYHCPRWAKLSNESYGRSPAMKCLPDIKMLNAMKRVVIKAADKAVDPPLMLPSDGYASIIKTAPGDLNYYEPGSEPIQPLPTDPRGISIGLDMIERVQEHIRDCFYFNKLIRGKKKERQSIYEVQDDRNEMLRDLSPIVARLNSELLGPMITRSYELLQAAGRIPPAPPSLQKKKLKVFYCSPAARAQIGVKADVTNRFLQEVIPMLQASPEAADRINWDNIIEDHALNRDVPMRAIRSDEEVAQLRASRAEAQQLQTLAGAAEPVSKALKNVAEAQSVAPI